VYLAVAGPQYVWQLSSPVWLILVGALWLVLGAAFDWYTTASVFRLKPQFDRLGTAFPIEEQNRLLPKHPTVRHLLTSRSTLVEFFFLLAALWIPAVGIAMGTGHFLAGLGNVKQAQRLMAARRMLTPYQHDSTFNEGCLEGGGGASELKPKLGPRSLGTAHT